VAANPLRSGNSWQGEEITNFDRARLAAFQQHDCRNHLRLLSASIQIGFDAEHDRNDQ
jgi:hypothetical protein